MEWRCGQNRRNHGRPLGQRAQEGLQLIGPAWSDDDQRFAKALQKELKQEEKGLNAKPDSVVGSPPADAVRDGGGSDDIGDVSWAVPTVTLRYPSNIPGTPGHNWADAIAMATPVAHKGATAGAKAQALTVLDLLLNPKLIADAWDYYRNVQTKDVKYQPLLEIRRRHDRH